MLLECFQTKPADLEKDANQRSLGTLGRLPAQGSGEGERGLATVGPWEGGGLLILLFLKSMRILTSGGQGGPCIGGTLHLNMNIYIYICVYKNKYIIYLQIY